MILDGAVILFGFIPKVYYVMSRDNYPEASHSPNLRSLTTPFRTIQLHLKLLLSFALSQAVLINRFHIGIPKRESLPKTPSLFFVFRCTDLHYNRFSVDQLSPP